MLAVCSMLLPTYYSKNYAGIHSTDLMCNQIIMRPDFLLIKIIYQAKLHWDTNLSILNLLETGFKSQVGGIASLYSDFWPCKGPGFTRISGKLVYGLM